MTVSNVINGRRPVSGVETRDQVLASMSALGYRVNLSARDLRRGRTGRIGLAVPDFAPAYFAQLAQRLVVRFAEHGYRLVIEHAGVPWSRRSLRSPTRTSTRTTGSCSR